MTATVTARPYCHMKRSSSSVTNQGSMFWNCKQIDNSTMLPSSVEVHSKQLSLTPSQFHTWPQDSFSLLQPLEAKNWSAISVDVFYALYLAYTFERICYCDTLILIILFLISSPVFYHFWWTKRWNMSNEKAMFNASWLLYESIHFSMNTKVITSLNCVLF